MKKLVQTVYPEYQYVCDRCGVVIGPCRRRCCGCRCDACSKCSSQLNVDLFDGTNNGDYCEYICKICGQRASEHNPQCIALRVLYEEELERARTAWREACRAELTLTLAAQTQTQET